MARAIRRRVRGRARCRQLVLRDPRGLSRRHVSVSNRDAEFGTSAGFVYSDNDSGPLSVGDTYTVAEVSDEYGVGGIFGQEVVVWQ